MVTFGKRGFFKKSRFLYIIKSNFRLIFMQIGSYTLANQVKRKWLGLEHPPPPPPPSNEHTYQCDQSTIDHHLGPILLSAF